jgi:DNA-binding MarR family transcriptional regulator
MGVQTTAAEASWTFLTNHAHVLLCLAREPEVRMRDVAALVGITERAVQRIVLDLEQGGYLERRRVGRCNRYHVRPDQPLRHPIEQHEQVASLIALVLGRDGEESTTARGGHARRGGSTDPRSARKAASPAPSSRPRPRR